MKTRLARAAVLLTWFTLLAIFPRASDAAGLGTIRREAPKVRSNRSSDSLPAETKPNEAQTEQPTGSTIPTAIEELREKELGKNRLPFPIADEKRLDPTDLADKKPGFFLTGLPQVTSDPVEGTGFGVNAYFNFNGRANDPFFPYAPYRSRLGVEASIETKGAKQALVEFDAPYAFDSKWRIRSNVGIMDDPNQLYFGSSAASMNTLHHLGQNYGQYSAYETALETIRSGNPGEPAFVTDEAYNRFRMRELDAGFSMEYSFLEGKMRALGGLGINVMQVSTFDGSVVTEPDGAGNPQSVPNGTSLLTSDAALGLRGVGNNFISTLRGGVVYDTRDLEPDPGRGLFVELTNELSLKPLGSNFNFDKIFLQAKYFLPLLAPTTADLVLAMRLASNLTIGDAPFFEYGDGWSSEGDIDGVGGLRTLRGYKESRFLAPLIFYGNLELRYGFADVTLAGQKLVVKVVPFFDFGRVWNRLSDLSFTSYRGNGGLGLRVVWNQSTVLIADYAVSSEDQQFFLNFDHIF